MRISDWSSDVCSSDLRAAPPLSGVFTCKGMLARNPDSDNIKLPGCGDFLCIISRELHNDFTSCPQDCPQGRRRSEFAKACGAKACGPPPRREATLTYVALRSKSQADRQSTRLNSSH